jgi:hypothetical protein
LSGSIRSVVNVTPADLSLRVRRVASLLSLCVASAVLSNSLAAQDAERKTLCLRAAPAPRCEWLLITEVGYSVPIARGSPSVEGKSSNRITVALGALRNLGPRDALGGAVFFAGLDADASRSGAQLRYRRWVSQSAALEAGAGVIWEATDLTVGPRLPGFRAQVGFDFRNIVGVTTQVDIIATESGAEGEPKTFVDWYAGARIGGGVGLVGVAALGLLTIIAVASLDS